MLWVGMFLTTVLSYLQRASALRVASNMAVAFVVVVLGNVLRNTLLFLKEARIVHLPEWTHAVTGVGALSAHGGVDRRPGPLEAVCALAS